MASRQDLTKHVELVGNVVRSTLLKRSLTSVNADPQLNFWRIIYGNLLDVAVVAWCMIFGADSEPTHWKKIVPVYRHELFRASLLSAMSVDESQWAAYWEEMKAYRDTQVAHYQEGAERYPSLGLALESSYFYYGYLLKELRQLGETGFPGDLRQYGEKFEFQSVKIANVALNSTAAIKEEVF